MSGRSLIWPVGGSTSNTIRVTPTSVPAATFILGVTVSFALGYSAAIARRAWTDYRRVKASVKPMRNTAWRLIGAAFSKGGLVAAACGG